MTAGLRSLVSLCILPGRFQDELSHMQARYHSNKQEMIHSDTAKRTPSLAISQFKKTNLSVHSLNLGGFFLMNWKIFNLPCHVYSQNNSELTT